MEDDADVDEMTNVGRLPFAGTTSGSVLSTPTGCQPTNKRILTWHGLKNKSMALLNSSSDVYLVGCARHLFHPRRQHLVDGLMRVAATAAAAGDVAAEDGL